MTSVRWARIVGAAVGISAKRIVISVITGIALAAGSLATSPAPTLAASSADPMDFGILPTNSKIASVQSLETAAGRSYAYIRVYRSWNDTFPDADVDWMESTGHSLYLSVKARMKDGSNVSYAQIAAAQPGSTLYTNMVRWATAIKGYNRPIYLSFNHEPDTSNSQASGNATQFIAAYRKFVTVMRAENVTNARFAFTTAVRNYSVSPSNAKYAPAFYPGDAYVDVIAIDAYNMYCRTKSGSFANPWKSLDTLLAPFMTFAAAHPGPALVAAEWGSPEDPANASRKAQWITDARAMFKQPAYSRFIAVSYWNQMSHNYSGCDFGISSSAASLAAFKAMANDPFYSGTVS